MMPTHVVQMETKYCYYSVIRIMQIFINFCTNLGYMRRLSRRKEFNQSISDKL